MRLPLLIFLGFLWSARLAAIKAAGLSGIPLHVTISIAVLGIALTFTMISIARRSWPPLDRNALIFYLLSGIFGFILPFSLENVVGPRLPVFLFVVIISTMPVLTILLASTLGVEHPEGRQVIAVALGFLTAILIAVDARGAGQNINAEVTWIAIGFSVPVVYAANTIFIASRWPRSPDAIHVANAQAVIVGVSILVFGTATGGISEWTTVALNTPAILAITSCEALALLVYLKLARDHGAGYVAQANYISILFAAALGFVLFEENLSWVSVLAAVLLIVALRIGRPAMNAKNSATV
ncbi:MAG: DMT family transporter [Roseobacter sp.]